MHFSTFCLPIAAFLLTPTISLPTQNLEPRIPMSAGDIAVLDPREAEVHVASSATLPREKRDSTIPSATIEKRQGFGGFPGGPPPGVPTDFPFPFGKKGKGKKGGPPPADDDDDDQ